MRGVRRRNRSAAGRGEHTGLVRNDKHKDGCMLVQGKRHLGRVSVPCLIYTAARIVSSGSSICLQLSICVCVHRSVCLHVCVCGSVWLLLSRRLGLFVAKVLQSSWLWWHNHLLHVLPPPPPPPLVHSVSQSFPGSLYQNGVSLCECFTVWVGGWVAYM